MTWIITKYAITAALVVLISEVAKRNDKLGALIAALPLVTVLAMIWLSPSCIRAGGSGWRSASVPLSPCAALLYWPR